MLVLERYLTLYNRFAGEPGAGATAEASLEQVAEALFCTERNAKLVLRKLTEEGLIDWQAGRGRGNRSQITFREDREKLLLDLSKRYAEDGEYNKAFHLLRTFGEGTAANEKFMEWMSGNFGFRRQPGKEADVLRLPIFKTIMTLDPADFVYSLCSHMIQQIFDRLVLLDEATGQIKPGIAHYWEHNEDATVWTFHLRKGIHFHGGRELTAEDVVFTAERLKNGGKRNSWIMRSLERVEAVSERIVKFHLARPNWLFLKYASSNVMAILPANLLGLSEEQFWKLPSGTGPFQIEEWKDGKLLLGANPHYYQSRPHLDQVEIVHVPQEEARKAGMTSWQQLICDPTLRDVTVENGWIQIESKSLCTSLLSWNMEKAGPQRSEAFRRIVNRLIDRHAMIRELSGYRDFPARGFFPELATAHEPDTDRLEPEEAGRLLLEAGYNGEPLTLCAHPGHAEDVNWIADRCRRAGISVLVRIEAPYTIHHVLNEIDLLFHALVFPEEDVSLIEGCEQEGSFLKELMSPELSRWTMESFDRALASEDPNSRKAIYAGIEERLKDEAQVHFVLHMKFHTDYHPSLKGVRINSLGWIDFKDIFRT
ncbi:MarR-like DNA-binding transcriptional regulator SgrR of sgrS sRNA [Paenibacillus sp. BK033]|uniref:SgrR family transcriptional regulator n=1 Tax=Paenibacillus sp. BK033 TaxID=2512133 RepID=UPI0010436EAB|nr:SgrR family transcriptional regulator [Paenibacillus sp. BK033]TCM91051.1 MarR-like DNA-binding transcriptional regulator SgrR of sgrS sRNA [Paenibacillus sp. BK033]